MSYCVARNGWSDDAIAWLITAWHSEKYTTAEMGRALGCTKSAAVGKAHRLQLPAKPSPIRPKPAPRQPEKRHRRTGTKQRKPKAPKPEPKRPMPVLAKPEGPQCSWVEGPPYKFTCPNAPKVGSSYCEDHHKLIWHKPPRWRRRHEHEDSAQITT